MSMSIWSALVMISTHLIAYAIGFVSGLLVVAAGRWEEDYYQRRLKKVAERVTR